MHFEITHTTVYQYSRQVFLEPHVIRVIPRTAADQRLLHFDLSLDPPPSGTTYLLDAEGNTLIHAWFSEMTDRLSVTVVSRVETLRENPFDYLLPSEACRLPLTYNTSEATLLLAALRRSTVESSDDVDEVGQFARLIMNDAGRASISCCKSGGGRCGSNHDRTR